MEAFERRGPRKSLLRKDRRVDKCLTEQQIDDLLDARKCTDWAAQFVDRGPGRKERPLQAGDPLEVSPASSRLSGPLQQPAGHDLGEVGHDLHSHPGFLVDEVIEVRALHD